MQILHSRGYNIKETNRTGLEREDNAEGAPKRGTLATE